MKNIAVIGAGISGSGGRVFPEPPAPRAPVREGAASRRPHQHGGGRRRRRPAWRSTPASSCTTTAPIRTSCGCSASSAWPRATRTCPSPCRAGGPGSSTAAAAPTASSRSDATWSAVAPLAAPRRSCASIGRRRRCSTAPDGGTPDARRLSRVAPLRRGVHPSVSVSHGVGHLVGLARRDPIVSRAHAHPLLRQPRAAVAHAQPTWKVVAGGSHTYIPRLMAPLVGRHSPGRVDSVRCGEASDGVTITLPRSAIDAVRRCGVRVPWRPGVAAARRSERPRARCVLALHDHDQHGLAAHGRLGAARRRHGPARRGITCSPATPMRRRR